MAAALLLYAWEIIAMWSDGRVIEPSWGGGSVDTSTPWFSSLISISLQTLPA